MIYQDSDGSMFIGKCTDMERLGPAVTNPFLTSCGAKYTLEAAAKASEILGEDKEKSVAWKSAATKLFESLPRENGMFFPYSGCKDKNVAVLGGLFPYPLFDRSNELQYNAVYDFLKNISTAGNMYPMGKGISAWYAGWMTTVLTRLRDREGSEKMLSVAAKSSGIFSEMFEINEPEIHMHPWFSTASGSYIYGLNQMLLQSEDDQILNAPAVPVTWGDFSFKLPCVGDVVVTASIEKGQITLLDLSPGNSAMEITRTLIIPEQFFDKKKLSKDIVTSLNLKMGITCSKSDLKGIPGLFFDEFVKKQDNELSIS